MCWPQRLKTKAKDANLTGIVEKCPFTIDRVNPTTHLIRERDKFGEYPHIYAKLCKISKAKKSVVSVLILTDTGVGTSVANADTSKGPPTWTIYSFLEQTINPGHQIPYLIITSHCHYDHILGLHHFLSESESGSYMETRPHYPRLTILSSSYAPSFVTPWTVLNRHSLCEDKGCVAPNYKVDIWAKDNESITYMDHPSNTKVNLPATVLHTPGHTPDSLTWYDHEERAIFVGDSLYHQQSSRTVRSPWGREPLMPIYFPVEGDIRDWWYSMNKVIAFVQRKNLEGHAGVQRIKLFAGHVTTDVDAETCLQDAKSFMARVLRKEVAQHPFGDDRGHPRAYWSDAEQENDLQSITRNFSLVAPIELVERARKSLPRSEWAKKSRKSLM